MMVVGGDSGGTRLNDVRFENATIRYNISTSQQGSKKIIGGVYIFVHSINRSGSSHWTDLVPNGRRWVVETMMIDVIVNMNVIFRYYHCNQGHWPCGTVVLSIFKFSQVADLKTARWGRPSVGTIGGKITGLECFDDEEEACDGGDKIGKIKQQLS